MVQRDEPISLEIDNGRLRGNSCGLLGLRGEAVGGGILDNRQEEALKIGPAARCNDADVGQLWHWEQPRRVANRAEVDGHVRSLPAKSHQSLLALYMGPGFDLLATEIFGRGNAGECGIEPMRIIRLARQLGAIGFILVHHDPERTSAATADEISMTHKMRRAAEDFHIHLLDHLILGRDRMRDVPA